MKQHVRIRIFRKKQLVVVLLPYVKGAHLKTPNICFDGMPAEALLQLVLLHQNSQDLGQNATGHYPPLGHNRSGITGNILQTVP